MPVMRRELYEKRENIYMYMQEFCRLRLGSVSVQDIAFCCAFVENWKLLLVQRKL